jgi:hypothetical protein
MSTSSTPPRLLYEYKSTNADVFTSAKVQMLTGEELQVAGQYHSLLSLLALLVRKYKC